MKRLHLLPIGEVDRELIDWLGRELVETFRVPAEFLRPLEVDFAYHPERDQFHSSELLAQMHQLVRPDTWRLIGITAVDLYIPILTFVFGEAQIGGPCSVVSYHRLRQDFYGLPADRDLLARRLLTESVHELGHTLTLTHCADYRCVMASSHVVEWIDIKENAFCPDCATRAEAQAQW
jgi:archaemetzincin